MIHSLRTWWKRLRAEKIKRVVIVDSMTAVPTACASDLYLVRHGSFDKRAVFDCPCGCGRRIDLNLVQTQHPSWSAKLRNGRITLAPSIWLTADPCRSHFFVRNSKIEWADARSPRTTKR